MNLLFTCAGRRNYLINYFKDVLKDKGTVFAADVDRTASALAEADKALQVPDIYAQDYIDTLIYLCKSYNIDAIVSLNDLELPILSDRKKEFEAIGITVVVSNKEVIDIAFDKLKTHNYLEDIGLNSPKTFTNLDIAINALTTGQLSFPLILKPRWGSASIGIEFAETLEELQLTYKLLRIKLSKSILNEASKSDLDNAILIQEQLNGFEYGLDIVNDLNGNYVGTFVRKKLNMRAGETDKAISVIDERFNEIGKLIGNNLGHIGNLDCDIFEVDDKLYVLELNPRFGGGYPFSHEAGVNTAGMYVNWLNNRDDITSFLNYKAGVMVTKCDRMLTIYQ